MARRAVEAEPARRRPQARGVATRARLLRAAEELFGRHGYEATSMTKVAEAAGVAVGGLCHHSYNFV